MSQNKTEKIATIEEKIQQLENQRKQLIQKQKEQERKARVKRLIERGAILESFIIDADKYSNEQIQTFLQKTIRTDFAKRVLSDISRADSTT